MTGRMRSCLDVVSGWRAKPGKLSPPLSHQPLTNQPLTNQPPPNQPPPILPPVRALPALSDPAPPAEDGTPAHAGVPAAAELKPNVCPPEGVEFVGKLGHTHSAALPEDTRLGLADEAHARTWVFFWNHFISIPFFNENILHDVPAPLQLQIGYPVRLAASGGYRREFNLRGGPDRALIGDQTLVNLVRAHDDGSSAEPLVGSLVPMSDVAFAAHKKAMQSMSCDEVAFEHFTWLAWMNSPAEVQRVYLFRPGPKTQAAAGPPTFELPMLQSHVMSP